MEVNIGTVIAASVGILTLGTAVVGFFQLQTRQNMKIEALEKIQCKCREEVDEKHERLEKKISDQNHYQIQTEKRVDVMVEKMARIETDVSEIKSDIKELLKRGA